MVKGMVDYNPCRGVRRNTEKARDRTIEDHEYWTVLAKAEPSVKRMMTLIDRTCQRPEDLFKAGISNIKKIQHEGREVRALRISQRKSGKTVDIVLAGDLEKLVDEHLAAKTV